jgi:hypothetical protein
LAHKLLSDFLQRSLLEADPKLSKTSDTDWLKFDQYLGILLTGWSVEAVEEVINRNIQRRLKSKAKKTVQFTLPVAEEKGRALSVEEANWSVEQWLEDIGMAKYQDNFHGAGYTSLQDIQVCVIFDWEVLFSFSLTLWMEIGLVECNIGENGHQCPTSS